MKWLCRKVQMETSRFITLCDLCSQGVKLLCRRAWLILRAHQLSLANGVHDFHTSDRTAGRPQRFKAQHGIREAFHRTMVLLHDIVEIRGVADNDTCLVSPVVALDRRGGRATLINRDLFRQLLVPNGLA